MPPALATCVAFVLLSAASLVSAADRDVSTQTEGGPVVGFEANHGIGGAGHVQMDPEAFPEMDPAPAPDHRGGTALSQGTPLHWCSFRLRATETSIFS